MNKINERTNEKKKTFFLCLVQRRLKIIITKTLANNYTDTLAQSHENTNRKKDNLFMFCARVFRYCIISHQIFKIIVRGEWIFIVANVISPQARTNRL